MLIQPEGTAHDVPGGRNVYVAGKYESVTLLAPPTVIAAPGVANTFAPALIPVTVPVTATVLQFGFQSTGTVVLEVYVVTCVYGRYSMTMKPCLPTPPAPPADPAL